ncbi:hypothetical protein F4677DRAFT_459645 [Hypoxylon crocopeplum]|nr:hypothetical protein F4677DRAFT_459645 [Hypoxylon crocopeplum]
MEATSVEAEDYLHDHGTQTIFEHIDETSPEDQTQRPVPVSTISKADLPNDDLESQTISTEIQILRHSPPISPALVADSKSPVGVSAEETHNDDSSAAPDSAELSISPISSTPLSLEESLGKMGVFTIVGGYIEILAVLAFLAFLWNGYGPSFEAADASCVWRQIALHDWMTQTVTLCALALRFTVSLQSTVCTSMIAALVLEKRFALRIYVAYFSVLRSVNDGPQKLLQMMLFSGTSMLKYVELWLAIFLTITTFALQFTSTILLADFRDFVMVGNINRTQVPSLLLYAEDQFHLSNTAAMFTKMQIFAEAQSKSNALPDPFGFSDTGFVQRGFLPFAESESRLSLRHFNGNIMTMNSKVACMRPVLDAHYKPLHLDINTDIIRLVGLLQYGSSLRHARASRDSICNSSECEEAYFECPMAYSHNRIGSWESIFCLVGGVGGNVWGDDLGPKWESDDEPWSLNSTIQLVITTNMRQVDWDKLPSERALGIGKPYHEWQSFELLPGRYINATVCFSAFNIARKYAHITAQDVLSELSINWSLTSLQYDCTDVQKLMGVDVPNRTYGERGILRMDILGGPNDGPSDGPAYKTVAVPREYRVENGSIADFTTRILETIMGFGMAQSKGWNTSTMLCYLCDGYGFIDHPTLGLLCNSIITETGRAANALQSYMTALGLMWYDQYLNSLGELQWADMAMTKMVRTPGPCSSQHGCGGYISVVILLLIYLVYVAVITTLYVKQVRYSRYNNLWHTISQLVADELRVLLEQANNTGDEVVESLFKEQGDDRVRLGKVVETGRIEVVKFSVEGTAIESRSSRLARLKGMLDSKRWRRG